MNARNQRDDAGFFACFWPGGLEPGPAPQALEGRICGRLLKPFRVEELASAVAVGLAEN